MGRHVVGAVAGRDDGRAGHGQRRVQIRSVVSTPFFRYLSHDRRQSTVVVFAPSLIRWGATPLRLTTIAHLNLTGEGDRVRANAKSDFAAHAGVVAAHAGVAATHAVVAAAHAGVAAAHAGVAAARWCLASGTALPAAAGFTCRSPLGGGTRQVIGAWVALSPHPKASKRSKIKLHYAYYAPANRLIQIFIFLLPRLLQRRNFLNHKIVFFACDDVTLARQPVAPTLRIKTV